MAKDASDSSGGGAPPGEVATELKDMVVGYARQEITDPMRRLGKALKFNILGALGIGIGLIFLAIAGLRLLQTEASGVFDGNLSALPYVVVLVALVLIFVATVAFTTRTPRGDDS